MATFEHLHHLLEQSLRDLQAESDEQSSREEAELTQALHRLNGHLAEILSSTGDPGVWSESHLEPLPTRISPVSPVSAPGSLCCMTNTDGTIMMANEATCEQFGIEGSKLGVISLADFMGQEEWVRIVRSLRSVRPSQNSVTFVVPFHPPGGSLGNVRCSVTPMGDHSRKITAWLWNVQPEGAQPGSPPVSSFVQRLETQLLAGQSVNACLTRICENLVQTFGYPFVWIATVRDGQTVQLRASAVSPKLDWEVHGPVWWARIAQQDTLAQACVADELSLVSGDGPYTGEFSWYPRAFPLHEACCLPLVRQGDLSGLMVVCSDKPNVFGQTARDWLKRLGAQIQGLVVHGRDLEQWRLHSAIMNSMTDAVCVTDSQGHLEWVNEAYTARFGVSAEHVLGAPLRSFPYAQLQDQWPQVTPGPKKIAVTTSEIMEKGKDGESFVFEQVLTPLFDNAGEVTHFVAILRDVTARKVAEMEMKYQAYHDSLTDLPNRVMFEDHLRLAIAQARRNGNLVALLFLDLDNFKAVNDQYGHQMGDRLLRVVAKRLVSCVRTTDTVSRLSGDEFVMILQNLDRIQDVRQVAQKILQCLTPPIRLNGCEVSIQTSIGISVYPKDSTDPRHLIEIADQAMYRSKEAGGCGWYFATPEWNFK